jgi:hypothetical protein
MPNTLYLGSQVQIIGSAVNMGSAVVDMTSAVVSFGAPTSAAHATTKSYVDAKISSVLSNLDPSAVDSFTEVITAFQAADSNLNGAITSLANSASSDLTSEVSRATAAELVLTNDLSAEASSARAAELVLTNDLSAEASSARAAELVLTNDLSAEASSARAAELVLTNALSAEASSARAAELVLTNDLSSEVSTRLAEDKKLLSATSRSTIVPLTTAICGGQALPAVMTSAISEVGYDGWYYKKVLNDSVNKKINWYLAPDVSMKISDLYQLFFELYLMNITSTPFITVYTKTDALTANGASWYKSKRTFEMLDKTNLVAGSNYCCHMKFNSQTPSPVSYAHTNRALTLSDVVANAVGVFDSSEEIMFFAFGTDSNTAVGNVEFICKSVCVQSAKGTQNFLFSNIHVESLALSTQVNNLYQYFFNQNRDGPVPSKV